MAVGDRQKFVTNIVAKILGEAPCHATFPWLKNKHTLDDFGPYYHIIDTIFHELGGDVKSSLTKQTKPLNVDAYFGGKWNFLFEFDEFQHFSTARLATLTHYPRDPRLTFRISDYKSLCLSHAYKADAYRKMKRTVDFDFVGGRTAQRAYLDCFRDLLPSLHGLKPTLRVTEWEVAEICEDTERSRTILENLIVQKLGFVG